MKARCVSKAEARGGAARLPRRRATPAADRAIEHRRLNSVWTNQMHGRRSRMASPSVASRPSYPPAHPRLILSCLALCWMASAPCRPGAEGGPPALRLGSHCPTRSGQLPRAASGPGPIRLGAKSGDNFGLQSLFTGKLPVTVAARATRVSSVTVALAVPSLTC